MVRCVCMFLSSPLCLYFHILSQYARVSADTNPEVLYHLLTEQWKLSPPNLLISVTGGAKNFHLKGHLKSMFHRGLIKVAQTTGQPNRKGCLRTSVLYCSCMCMYPNSNLKYVVCSHTMFIKIKTRNQTCVITHAVLYAGAWIITGGTNVGVMKHVGKAVRDYALSSSSMWGQIVAIGVATWGVIHNRDTLVSSEVQHVACLFLVTIFII